MAAGLIGADVGSDGTLRFRGSNSSGTELIPSSGTADELPVLFTGGFGGGGFDVEDLAGGRCFGAGPMAGCAGPAMLWACFS